ncbi:MAG: hypothetical protein U0574_03945 [Phycisphaerales bacterium]
MSLASLLHSGVVMASLGAPQTAPAPAGNPLAGPRVAPAAAPAAPSLITHDFQGRLQLVEGEPEQRALELLPLTPAETRALERVALRRMSDFDRLVKSHAGELIAAVGALQSMDGNAGGGPSLQALGHLMAAWEAFAPWRERGSVIDELGDAIAPERAAQARAMSAAYARAVARDVARESGMRPAAPQVQARVRLEAFGRLVQAAFERMERQGQDELARATEALSLTPDQVEKAKVIFGSLAQMELRREATGWDRFKAFSEFMASLTPEQRTRAWRFIRRGG